MGWCARNPYLVASSAFSGKLSVFSLFGGNEEIPEQPERVGSIPLITECQKICENFNDSHQYFFSEFICLFQIVSSTRL